MLVASKSKPEISLIKHYLQASFEMKGLGAAQRILGMDIQRDREKGELWLVQHDYIQKRLKRFQMHESIEVSVHIASHFKLSTRQSPVTEAEQKEMDQVPYANIVGSILYTMMCTRQDIAHVVSFVSRYMGNPGKDHWNALKRVLGYLKGSANCGILFRSIEGFCGEALTGYVDTDHEANLENSRSQSGYIFN